MGVLNMTPDSFSDGGKYNKNYLAKKRLNFLFNSGANIVDIGGESTRPGSKPISSKIEWNRIKDILNPYFTTKKNGTGLGLSIVSKIINDHNGNLEFISQPNGAKIKIYFKLDGNRNLNS